MKAAVRKSRRGWEACAFGVVTVAALLASTACSPNPGDGTNDNATSDQSGTTSPTSPAPPGSGTPPAKPAPGTSRTDGNGSAAACTQADVSLAATSQDEKGRSVRHILLTVTNTSDKECSVYRYPLVQLDDANASVTEIKDSANPDEPLTTLAPGRQAYAAMILNGPMDEAQAKAMTVALQGPEAGRNATMPINVALPGVDTLYYNDFARVTHWTTASGYALRFVMSS
ncbi:DUF4232 domain-containing protein [Streptomyces sp. NPDC060048]|uniref:DUF4232 domain-containing protein n=1 Tax=unclassified Streptomyces TaxID=2593676 RepID=UPI0036B13EE8